MHARQVCWVVVCVLWDSKIPKVSVLVSDEGPSSKALQNPKPGKRQASAPRAQPLTPV